MREFAFFLINLFTELGIGLNIASMDGGTDSQKRTHITNPVAVLSQKSTGAVAR